ncbi:MAG: fatty acid desaturase [bacterium]|nr:fatty acid desaturase [bacterium]
MYYQLLLVFGVAMLLSQVAVLATTIQLHRAATHATLGGLVLDPKVAWACNLILWITTGQRRRQWVAVHRKHHVFTDKVGDPHSPRVLGFWHVQLGNVFYYVWALREKDILDKYAPDIQEDKWDRWLFNHGKLGLLLGTVALCSLMGMWWGLLTALIHAVTYIFVIASSINGLCHTYGYRNFDNTATNLRLLAWITGGEGLHNNHHEYPTRAKFSFFPGEWDPGWSIIKLLIRVNLATMKKTLWTVPR